MRPVADLVPHRAASSQVLQAFPRIKGISDAEVVSFVAGVRR
jgi:hypothetical protein